MSVEAATAARPLARGAMLALVAAGGAAGASARVLVELAVFALGGPPFLWLMLVNLAGSFVLGIAFARLDPRSPQLIDIDRPLTELPGARAHHPVLAAFLAAGFCGALTTWSSLAAEVVALWHAGDVGQAGLLLGSSLALGPPAIAAGVRAGRRAVTPVIEA